MRPVTRLPWLIALVCVLVIVYASLQPFAGWRPDEGFSLRQLSLSLKWVSRADVVFNLLAYVPLGFAIVALTPSSWSPRARWSVVLSIALGLSLAMELLQTALPARVASGIDVLVNLTGAALGAGLGLLLLRHSRIVALTHGVRERWFVPGLMGDAQIMLLVVWLLAHINPAIPLFGATFHPGVTSAFESAMIAVELFQTAAGLIGIGLFTDLAMRKRFGGGFALVLVLALACAMKMLAAQAFLTPIAWETWFRPGNALGIVVGAVALTLLFWLPRNVKSVIAGIALVSGALAPALLPDLLELGPQLSQFAWHYGQLLNLNGLTRTLIVIWPFAATLVLFTRFGFEARDNPAPTSAPKT